MALSRSRGFEADRTGANLTGDGEALARALIKLGAIGQGGTLYQENGVSMCVPKVREAGAPCW